MGEHSEARITDAMNQYGAALKAFFRTINTPDGGQANEGADPRQIRKLDKHQRGTGPCANAAGQTAAAEMRRKAHVIWRSVILSNLQQCSRSQLLRALPHARSETALLLAKQHTRRNLTILGPLPISSGEVSLQGAGIPEGRHSATIATS